jgi:hypothetical protein
VASLAGETLDARAEPFSRPFDEHGVHLSQESKCNLTSRLLRRKLGLTRLGLLQAAVDIDEAQWQGTVENRLDGLSADVQKLFKILSSRSYSSSASTLPQNGNTPMIGVKSPEAVKRASSSALSNDVFQADWQGAGSAVGLPFNDGMRRRDSSAFGDFADSRDDSAQDEFPDDAIPTLLSFFYTELAPFLHATAFTPRIPVSSRLPETLLDSVALAAAALHHPSPVLSATYPKCRDRLRSRYVQMFLPREQRSQQKSLAETVFEEVDDVKGICAAVAFLCDDGGQAGEWRRLIGVGKALSDAWQGLPHAFDPGKAEREVVAALLKVIRLALICRMI